jgi:hypothetical protein
MPDIAMCTNTACPLADSCYRKQAKPNEYYQAYHPFEYKIGLNGAECEYFEPMFKVVNSNKTN